MAIDVSYRDTFTTSAEDLSRTNKNFIINEGVAFDGLKVTQSGTPAMSVAVSAGTGYFYGSGTNSNVMYEFYSDASETVTIGASGVQARIDIICLKVDSATQVASIVAIAGTPSGSPAVPATPASHYKLAEVAVGISVTTIVNTNITDRRRSVFVAPTGARNQGLIGGIIQPTVASNNLTLAIKTLTGTDPTPSNPVGVWIGGQLRWITSALSFTRNGGTSSLNMGSAELATREVDLFAYLQWNTTTQSVNLLASRIPFARKMSEFVNSATDAKGALGIINYNANDDVVLVDRFSTTSNSSNNFTATGNVYGEPVYETRLLDWVPVYTASGGMTATLFAEARNRIKYTIKSDMLWVEHSALVTNGGTVHTTIIHTLPFIIGTSANQGGRSSFTVPSINNVIGRGSGADTGPTNLVEVSRFDGANQSLGTFWDQWSGWANLR